MILNVVTIVIFKREGPTLLVCLQKRKKEPMAGHYVTPGGKLEIGETLVHACLRELEEELGAFMDPGKIKPLPIIEHIVPPFGPEGGVHTLLHSFWTAARSDFIPYNLEPDKHESVEFYDVEALPSPLIRNPDKVIDRAIAAYWESR